MHSTLSKRNSHRKPEMAYGNSLRLYNNFQMQGMSCCSEHQKWAKIHEKIHTGEHKVPCPVCKVQINRVNLKQHMLLHSGKRRSRVTCQKCNKQVIKLRRRMNMIHGNQAKMECKACGKIFKNIRYMKEHSKFQHENAKKFKCLTCPAAFGNKSRLIKHKLVHVTLRAYKCQYCSKAFKDAYGLKAHGQRCCKKGTTPLEKSSKTETQSDCLIE